MSSSFQFELVSPEKMLVSKPAVLATMPGTEGVFGVLPEHAPLITTIAPGIVEVCEQSEGTITDRYFVAGGFCEVTPTSCTVLAEEAVLVADLDRPSLESEQRELAEKIAASNDNDREALQKKMAIIDAKIAAV